jgi:hypothetical protein
MPFLPSEAEESNLVFQQEMKDVLVFHYLPILWYRYPIPNEIREFWYNDRPEILDYMQKAYKDLDIQFLPDSILQDFNQQKLTSDLSYLSDSLLAQDTSLSQTFSTEMLSNVSQNEFFPKVFSIFEHLYHF